MRREWRDQQGRYVGPVGKRISAVRRAIGRQALRLERSRAHVTAPRPSDLSRWAKMADELDGLRAVLAALERGEDPPPAASTGSRSIPLSEVGLDEDGHHAQA